MSVPGVASSGCASGVGSKDFLDNWGLGVRQSCVGMVTRLFSGAALGTRSYLPRLLEGQMPRLNGGQGWTLELFSL